MKPSAKGSVLRSILRAFGMDLDLAASSPSSAVAQPDGSADSPNYDFHGAPRDAWLEAEQAKANAITELQRRSSKLC